MRGHSFSQQRKSTPSNRTPLRGVSFDGVGKRFASEPLFCDHRARTFSELSHADARAAAADRLAKTADMLSATLRLTIPIPPPPRIVATSGLVFAVLLTVSLMIVRLALPSDPKDPGAWLADPALREWVTTSLNLIPFAGLAFLWFMATFRNHIGRYEDRFFATVYLGSGFLFVAMLFAAVAIAHGLVGTFERGDDSVAQSESYRVGRATVYSLMNFFGMRMAAVFMFVTSTIGLRTSVLSKWVSLTGFVFGVMLLTAITHFAWIALLFPLWVMVVSTYLLVVKVRAV